MFDRSPSPLRAISQTESDMIRSMRVICIFLMIYAHVDTSGAASIINTGAYSWVSEYWIDFLARASVATLSFVSGFLSIAAINSGRVLPFIQSRFVTLIIPMAFWNMTFIAMAVAAAYVGVHSSALDYFRDADAWTYINALTGLGSEPVSQSLFFLRDLFVSSILLAVTWPLLRHALIPVIILLCAAAIFDALEPVIFRPTVPLFLFAGCMARIYGLSLESIARHFGVLGAAALLLIVSFFLDAAQFESATTEEVANIIKRAALTVFVIFVAERLSRTPLQALFAKFEPLAYLTYLSHARSISVLHLLLGLKPMSSGFLIFFFVAPIASFAIAVIIRMALSVLPNWVSILMQGKGKGRLRSPKARPA